MNIGVLTSSRADYGIYLPLLRRLKSHKKVKLKIIAFGSHLSKKHGYTLNQIKNDGFKVFAGLHTMPETDSAKSIAQSMGKTIETFASFWNKNREQFDVVLCLGDRYEMFAAVSAGVVFGIKFAHFHGGETSLGAIDEAFRHSITAMSELHFTATQKSMKRVRAIKGSKKNIYNVGALSLDNLNDIDLLSPKAFEKKFGVLPEKPLLVTFHPETVNYTQNGKYAEIICRVLKKLKSQVFITLPNADTNSEIIRKKFIELGKKYRNIHCFESLGTQGYFSAMKFCWAILGNSSSGIIEAASFSKPVMNLGHRQDGRERGSNVVDCIIEEKAILKALKNIQAKPAKVKSNVYGNGTAVQKVMKLLLD